MFTMFLIPLDRLGRIGWGSRTPLSRNPPLSLRRLARPAYYEFLPYNRLDWTKIRDNLHYPKLAAHGFVGVRVDMRGSGDSDGLYFDEYVRQEQEDCCEVIEWISRQEWSDGSVGITHKFLYCLGYIRNLAQESGVDIESVG
ncbi:predicted protein [Nematostella vectensis]|uniref:Xaa-Pro dipeptidyl-peptidase-like domain-containing protein n=1 Tax=Nematostella vectensis TaxID=45351 RepID=A7T0P1_NEMVE|nr:predicted protein [Nematostella vectensis]|eukprot:XP_001622580.1 predicted protein [Nematostella vectensis]